MTYPKARYFQDRGEASAVLRLAHAGPDLALSDDVHVHYLATDVRTSGDFGLFRLDMGPNPSGPMPHFHRTISESFFIISGTVRVHDGTRWIDATFGDYLFVPAGGIHGFRNESGEPASLLILFAPGAPREKYFEECAAVNRSVTKLSDEEWTDLYARHDQYMV